MHTKWRWERKGTRTIIRITYFGMVFLATRKAFKPHWRLSMFPSGSHDAKEIFVSATPKMVVRRIRSIVGERLAREFAGAEAR
jgi:hypothetical protein